MRGSDGKVMSIEGRVTDGVGHPVADVLVAVTATADRRVARTARRRAGSFFRFHVPTAVARTDGQGNYSVRDWPLSKAYVDILAPGWQRISASLARPSGMGEGLSRRGASRAPADDVRSYDLRVGRLICAGVHLDWMEGQGAQPRAPQWALVLLADMTPPPVRVASVPYRFDDVVGTRQGDRRMARLLSYDSTIEPGRYEAGRAVIRMPGLAPIVRSVPWQWVSEDGTYPRVDLPSEEASRWGRLTLALKGIGVNLAGCAVELKLTFESPEGGAAETWPMRSPRASKEGRLVVGDHLGPGRYRIKSPLFREVVVHDLPDSRSDDAVPVPCWPLAGCRVIVEGAVRGVERSDFSLSVYPAAASEEGHPARTEEGASSMGAGSNVLMHPLCVAFRTSAEGGAYFFRGPHARARFVVRGPKGRSRSAVIDLEPGHLKTLRLPAPWR